MLLNSLTGWGNTGIHKMENGVSRCSTGNAEFKNSKLINQYPPILAP
jgi:hypothetical protein